MGHLSESDFQAQMLKGLDGVKRELSDVSTKVAVVRTQVEATNKHLESVSASVSEIRSQGTQKCATNEVRADGVAGRVATLEDARDNSNRRVIAWGSTGILGGGGLLAIIQRLFEVGKGGGTQ